MNTLNKVEIMLAKLDLVMRLLRRRPVGKQRLGRGVYRLLNRIREHEGISTRELADSLGMRPSSLNEKLASLEKEEIIIRERDQKDQRVFIVKLQPKGVELYDEIIAERQNMNEAIGRILSEEEMKTFTSLAEKLAEGLEKRAEESPDEEPICQ
jgi:DNA-binding MarR family transcriptional regulator